MNQPVVQNEKQVDINLRPYLICEEIKQENLTSSNTETEQLKVDPNDVFYEKIKPLQPEKLDIEAIIAEYNMSVSSKHAIHPQKIDKKEKHKISIKKISKESNKVSIIPKMIINQESIQLINSFKKILNQKFNGFMNELTKQRKTCLQRLFNYLCFGFQQILESFKTDASSLNILTSINKDDILMLLKQRALAIDLEILNTHKNTKRNEPSLKFKNQWKHILDLLKQPGNSKLRQAIIIDEVPSSLLVYAREIDLIKYLSNERQDKLKFEAEQILRNSETGNQWILNHSDAGIQENSQEKSLPTDSETETAQDSQASTFEHDSVEKVKSIIQKSKKHKNKKLLRSQENQLIEQKKMRKMMKRDENLSK